LRELVRTNDIVLVSAIGALLDGAGAGIAARLDAYELALERAGDGQADG